MGDSETPNIRRVFAVRIGPVLAEAVQQSTGPGIEDKRGVVFVDRIRPFVGIEIGEWTVGDQDVHKNGDAHSYTQDSILRMYVLRSTA